MNEKVPYRRSPVFIALESRQDTPVQQQQGGGKRYKFQGSSIAVVTDFAAIGSPSIVITGASKTNPCVLTVPAHGRSVGDIVYVSGVVGMTELNNSAYIVSASSDSSHITLYETDATAYGTYVSGGQLDVATLSNWCELTGYDRTGATSPTIPATTICSTAEEYEVGLRGSGTTKIDFNFAPLTAIQVAIKAFDASKALMGVKIVLPNSGGTLVQLGFVQQLSEKAAVGSLWTGSLTILNTGSRLDY